MGPEIREETIGRLAEHGAVPIAFPVAARVRVVGDRLLEEPVVPPWVKDYDAEPGNAPADWTRRFDVSAWGLLAAWEAGTRIGVAVVAWNTRGLDLLEGRDDLALLWDLRVEPARRRTGVGTALLQAVVRWARERSCVHLDVETQDVNVPACRFYAQRGFRLRRVDANAYPSHPDETRLIWRHELGYPSP